MSGRSSGNSLWNCEGHNWGMNTETGKRCVGQKFWEYCLEKYDLDRVLEIREETRAYIVEGYKNLLNSITVPKILFLLCWNIFLLLEILANYILFPTASCILFIPSAFKI